MIDFNDVAPQPRDDERTPTTRQRYVPTAVARQAVGGHETEILDKLGISWRTREKHIRCPLGTHADNNPSWRWDRGKACYYCSCSSGSIFDVLMKAERLGDGDDAFDAAKIRAIELIGRADLIIDPAAEKPKGLTLEQYAAAKKLPVAWLRLIGLRQGSYGQIPAVHIPYLNELGGRQTTQFRVALTGDKRQFFKRERQFAFMVRTKRCTCSSPVTP